MISSVSTTTTAVVAAAANVPVSGGSGSKISVPTGKHSLYLHVPRILSRQSGECQRTKHASDAQLLQGHTGPQRDH